MLDVKTVDMPNTQEVEVTLTITHSRQARVTMEHRAVRGLDGILTTLRSNLAGDIIHADLANEWQNETRAMSAELESTKRELARITTDRNRLVRVVDKLTGA